MSGQWWYLILSVFVELAQSCHCLLMYISWRPEQHYDRCYSKAMYHCHMSNSHRATQRNRNRRAKLRLNSQVERRGYTATREFQIFLEMAVGWGELWNNAGISQAPAFDVFGIVPKMDQLWHSAGDICISRTPAINHVIKFSDIHHLFQATYRHTQWHFAYRNYTVTLNNKSHIIPCAVLWWIMAQIYRTNRLGSRNG